MAINCLLIAQPSVIADRFARDTQYHPGKVAQFPGSRFTENDGSGVRFLYSQAEHEALCYCFT
jgi:hypothetical protein